VVVENIYRHLHETGLSQIGESKDSIVSKSVKEVFKPVLFAILMITIIFLPIFSFESVGGKYYKPLALTIIFALISSLVIAFVFMPVMSYFILKSSKEEETKIMRYINDVYHKILYKLLRYPKAVISIVLTASIFSLFLLSRIGTEFAPTLDEGAVLVKSFLNPNVSLQESKMVASFVEEMAKSFPEIEYAFSNIGRPEKGEPEDVSYMETFITLKPYDQWENFKNRYELENALREKLKDFPGVSFSFTQPIQMRIDELSSGAKSTVAIKVFGDDLNKVNEIAFKIKEIVENTKCSVDVETESQSGKLQLKITPKIDQLNRYNLKTEDILALVGKYFTGYEANQVKKS
jgi:cobalt-zinc-cadmium resistance protein CzcA